MNAVGCALRKDQRVEPMRLKRMERGRAKGAERNADAGPLAWRQAGGERTEIYGSREVAAYVAQGKAREIVTMDAVGGAGPDEEVGTRKFDGAVTPLVEAHLGGPAAIRLRSPVKCKRIGRTDKG